MGAGADAAFPGVAPSQLPQIGQGEGGIPPLPGYRKLGRLTLLEVTTPGAAPVAAGPAMHGSVPTPR